MQVGPPGTLAASHSRQRVTLAARELSAGAGNFLLDDTALSRRLSDPKGVEALAI